MDRRRFVLTALGSALAAPLVAAAQEAGRVYRLGYLAGAAGPTASLLLRVDQVIE
jgi:hypothetical protein